MVYKTHIHKYSFAQFLSYLGDNFQGVVVLGVNYPGSIYKRVNFPWQMLSRGKKGTDITSKKPISFYKKKHLKKRDTTEGKHYSFIVN